MIRSVPYGLNNRNYLDIYLPKTINIIVSNNNNDNNNVHKNNINNNKVPIVVFISGGYIY